MLRPAFCSDINELAGYREARSQGKVTTFREAGFNSSCAWDRGSYGACLLQRNAQPFDSNYQVGVINNFMYHVLLYYTLVPGMHTVK